MAFSDYWSPSLGFWKGTSLGKRGEETETLEPMKEAWQMDLGTRLSDYVKQYVGQYKPGLDYAGLSKMMTPSAYEQQGLESLSGIMSRPMPKTFTEAGDVLSSTLKGEYDPFTSKYYESLRRGAEEERLQSIKQLNQQLSKAGLGGTSYRAGRIGDIELSSLNKVSDMMAKLQEAERTNQLNAINTAMQYAGLEETIPAGRLSQLMKYGALPRELEGIGYEDFIRKQGELSGVNTLAQQLFEYNIPYGKKSLTYETPSVGEQWMGEIMDIVKIVAAIKGAGGGAGGA